MAPWACSLLIVAFAVACRSVGWWRKYRPVAGVIAPLDPGVWLTNRYYQETHRWAGAGIPMGSWPPLLIQLADDCWAALRPTHPELSRTAVLRALQQVGRGGFPTLEPGQPDAD